MLEVEVRYRTANPAGVVARLQAAGATLDQDRTDEDLYFQAPDRDFKARDEAFRLRRIGLTNFLTFKGPRRDTETRTRTEIEIPLGAGLDVATDATALLQALGYRPLVTVRKRRTIYGLNREGFHLEVCFDDVERVGAFVELEILATEDQYEQARTILFQTAAELDLTEKETRSYLGMVLAALGQE